MVAGLAMAGATVITACVIDEVVCYRNAVSALITRIRGCKSETIGTMEVGTMEVGITEVGMIEVGITEVGMMEVGTMAMEVGTMAMEVGTMAMEIGAMEVGTMAMEVGDDGEVITRRSIKKRKAEGEAGCLYSEREREYLVSNCVNFYDFK